MSLKLFVVCVITFYLACLLQQTNATVMVESATGKALVQSACSASDSPPACYAVLNPIANNPNLNPTDICSAALKAATNVARVTQNMLNMSGAVATTIARDPAVRQSIQLCTQQYAQVLDLIDKSATALTQHVDEAKVPEYLSSAIAAVAKCDASAGQVANAAVQITNKNLDCSKILKNALGIYKVFAEYIENPSHDPKQIVAAASGNLGGNFEFNAGGSGAGDASGGIIGLSAPSQSPTSKDDASAGKLTNNNNMKFSFAKRGEYRKELSPSGKSPSKDNSGGKGSTPQKISTEMKYEGLGSGLGQRIKGFFSTEAEKAESGSSAGAPKAGSPPVSTSQKFEGLGLGLGDRIRGFFNPESENAEVGGDAGAAQTGSTPSQISTNQKFEGLGLGFGDRIRGFFNPDSGNSAGPPPSGSTSTNMKFEGLGLRQRIKGFMDADSENKDSGSGAGAPAQVSTNQKFEGLGLGFGNRIRGFFNHETEYSDTTGGGAGAGASQSGSSADSPDTGSTPSQISTSTKFEGLGLGFGNRIRGFLHPDSDNTDGAGEAPSGSSAGPPVNTGLKFSLSGFAKSFTKKHKEAKEARESKESGSPSPSPAPAKTPSSSSSSANTPTPVSTDAHADASDDGADSYIDDDVTRDTPDTPSPSPSGNTEVSLKYSLSHLIPDT